MSTLNWTYEIRDLKQALDAVREANPTERTAIAAYLDLLS
jgi:hypothetical protein